jgi:hypothetical protein
MTEKDLSRDSACGPRLKARGDAVEKKVQWPRGRRFLDFRDRTDHAGALGFPGGWSGASPAMGPAPRPCGAIRIVPNYPARAGVWLHAPDNSSGKKKGIEFVERAPKPYVQVVIDDLDIVVHDPEGHYDADHYDRYATFEQARDAALCCNEDVLDEGDYEGEDHKDRLEAMLRLLEAARSFQDLDSQPDYRRLLERIVPAWPAAA